MLMMLYRLELCSKGEQFYLLVAAQIYQLVDRSYSNSLIIGIVILFIDNGDVQDADDTA
jgi:hypothetical protein